jgi:Tfp pilus assembly protein PilV
VEVLISLFLISVGILSLLTLQPSAWRTSNRSDLIGRAAGILHQELEGNRVFILNENNSSPCLTTPCPQTNPLITTRTVYASGQQASQPGDLAFNVRTTTADLGNNSWRVTVQVTWPGNPTGISDTMVIGRQLSFMWPPL